MNKTEKTKVFRSKGGKGQLCIAQQYKKFNRSSELFNRFMKINNIKWFKKNTSTRLEVLLQGHVMYLYTDWWLVIYEDGLCLNWPNEVFNINHKLVK